MDIAALAAELTAGHPDTGAYSADPVAAAQQLNAVNRNKNLAVLSGDDMFAATDGPEFVALSAADKLLWVTFTNRAEIDPFVAANVALVRSIFGPGSTTVSNLGNLRKESVSRAVELGLGRIRPGNVIEARAL